jgi:hypothetical protein
MDNKIILLLLISILIAMYLQISELVILLLLVLIIMATFPHKPKPKKVKKKSHKGVESTPHTMAEDVESVSKHWTNKDSSLGQAAEGFGKLVKLIMGFIYGLFSEEKKEEEKPDKFYKVKIEGKIETKKK